MQVDQFPADNSPVAEHSRRASLTTIVLSLILAGVSFAIVSAATRFEFSHGLLYAWFGLVMAVFPPRAKFKWASHLIVAGLVLLSALSFLPAEWFSLPEWRVKLGSAGLETGSSVAMHPGQAREYILSFCAALLVTCFIAGWRTDTPTARHFALVFSILVAVYAVCSILLQEGYIQWGWDTEPTFGIFPNRNHTATLLSMGAVTSLAALYFAVREARSGAAGGAALSLMVISLALVRYNQSRAGLVLPFAGSVLWLSMLGRTWLTKRFLIVAATAAVCAGAIFWGTSSSLKSRFTAPAADEKDWGMAGGDDVPRTAVAGGEAYDFRLLVYRDTLAMITDAPVTGWGPGSFRYVFPQYRHWTTTSNNSLIMHPESDWLQLAAECGLPAAILAAGIVVAGVRSAIRKSKGGSSWPLRLGCLAAAILVPVHGLFDVPGHRIGLTWAAAFLFALSVRKSSRDQSPGRPVQLLWRLSGLLVLGIGTRQLLSDSGVMQESALTRPARREADARELLRRDQVQSSSGVSADAPEGAQADDPLERAIRFVSEAITDTPLDGDLHFLKGSLALYFTEKTEMALQAYQIERLLDPTWVQLPLRQSRNLLAIEPDIAVTLWRNAMTRAASLEAIAPKAYVNQSRTFDAIMRQAGQSGELSIKAAELIEGRPEFRVAWVTTAHASALSPIVTGWLSAGPGDAQDLQRIYDAWKLRQGADAEKWRKSRDGK